jgi:hypothetical protein
MDVTRWRWNFRRLEEGRGFEGVIPCGDDKRWHCGHEHERAKTDNDESARGCAERAFRIATGRQQPFDA